MAYSFDIYKLSQSLSSPLAIDLTTGVIGTSTADLYLQWLRTINVEGAFLDKVKNMDGEFLNNPVFTFNGIDDTITIPKTTEQNLFPLNDNLYIQREDTQAVIRSTISQQIDKLQVVDMGAVMWFDSTTSDTLTFIISGTTGETNYIYWGDGTKELITYTGEDQILTHSYTLDSGLYYFTFDSVNYSRIRISVQQIKGQITVDCDVSYYLLLYNLSLVTGDISNFNPSYYLMLSNLPLVTGDISNFNPSSYLNLYNLPLLTGDISNFNPSSYLYLYNLPLVTGDISNFNPSSYLKLYNLPLVTGDISNYNQSGTLYIGFMPLLTITNPMIFQYSLKLIYIFNCDLTEDEVGRIVQRAYDNGNTGGTIGITENSPPSATTQAQIDEMVTNRSWTITHD